MDFNKVNEANKAGENTPAASNINTDKQVIPPVEDGVDKQPANTVGFRDESLDEPYTEKRTITINLVTNYSLYRRANDKTLPKRMDKIGSCVRSSRTLSSNKGEIESYFPALIGLAPNNENFISRVKAYLNNISVSVDELGKTFDISFFWNRKRDYLRFRAEEEAIETAYMNSDRKGVKELREALEAKITKLNLLESEKYKYGYPIVLDDYLIYRHCLLYKDVAKDIALINSDPSIRFYLKMTKEKLSVLLNIVRKLILLKAIMLNFSRIVICLMLYLFNTVLPIILIFLTVWLWILLINNHILINLVQMNLLSLINFAMIKILLLNL